MNSDGDPPKGLLEFPVGDGVRDYCGPQQEGRTDVVYVTPGYFDTLQMPLLAGRVFTDADGPNAQHVVGALRVMRSELYGVGVYDAATLASAVLALVFVALLATILPTLKIAKIDPANTLREE